MHDINYSHEHELDTHDFLGCCKDCRASLDIIKPHIMGFAERIQKYDRQTLAALDPGELYRLYQLLDDLAHMDAGPHLAGLILDEPEIRGELPVIRSYYSTFFSVHENHLAKELLNSDSPWDTLQSFPLYPRYVALVRSQVEAVKTPVNGRMVFIGCGPVPVTLILMSRLYGIRSIGLDSAMEAVSTARQVIQCLGLANDIQIIPGDDSRLQAFSWDMLLVSALSEPKSRIFRTIREVLKKRSVHVPVIYRTYTGMRAVLYEPVQPEDINGFRIVQEIFPSGRVNNTTVIAELNE
jgi:hypothetical protein